MQPFTFISVIGEGSYGNVWKCLEQAKDRVVAVKKFKFVGEDEHARRLALKEIRLLGALDHPNIVRKECAFRNKKGDIYLVMACFEHTLLDVIQARPSGLPADELKLLMWQMFSATAYMHSSGVMHRDLKPSNILLNERQVKICDFGLSEVITTLGPQQYTPYVSTRWYRAPEVLMGDNYDAAIDVWSLGCIFAEAASGSPIFPGASTIDQLWHIAETVGLLPRQEAALAEASLNEHKEGRLTVVEKTLAERFPSAGKPMMQVLLACLQADPELRFTAGEILRLPYFFDIENVKARLNAVGGTFFPPKPQPPISDFSSSSQLPQFSCSNKSLQAEGSMLSMCSTSFFNSNSEMCVGGSSSNVSPPSSPRGSHHMQLSSTTRTSSSLKPRATSMVTVPQSSASVDTLRSPCAASHTSGALPVISDKLEDQHIVIDTALPLLCMNPHGSSSRPTDTPSIGVAPLLGMAGRRLASSVQWDSSACVNSVCSNSARSAGKESVDVCLLPSLSPAPCTGVPARHSAIDEQDWRNGIAKPITANRLANMTLLRKVVDPHLGAPAVAASVPVAVPGQAKAKPVTLAPTHCSASAEQVSYPRTSSYANDKPVCAIAAPIAVPGQAKAKPEKAKKDGFRNSVTTFLKRLTVGGK